MPGPLRMGFHKLLISIHLEFHVKARYYDKLDLSIGFYTYNVAAISNKLYPT